MHFKGHLAAKAVAALPCAHSHTTHLIGHSRFASTSSSSSTSTPFPFPAHRNPTPHQIFHLPSNASQAEIKARYYELARTFHPDSPASQGLSPSVRHAHFHAVTTAYDVLRGRSHAHHLCHGSAADDTYAAELARRRRQHARRQTYYRRAAPEFAEEGGMSGADDAWKDQLIIIVGLAVRTRLRLPRLVVSDDLSSALVDRRGLCTSADIIAYDSRCTASRCVC
ncbi:hypothetical protein BJV74DRAFT_772879 [Russula compacta]|nr:hypothetical protein BJV74DRAFT_772879 [Russula compacta]